MTRSRPTRKAERADDRPGAFSHGRIVIVSLTNPREKFWGTILDLGPAGLSIRGLELGSFDDYVVQIRAGEAVSANEVFFPMHRIERVEADLTKSGIPSVSDRFLQATGKPVTQLLGRGRERAQ